jgi:hypothetical protein
MVAIYLWFFQYPPAGRINIFAVDRVSVRCYTSNWVKNNFVRCAPVCAYPKIFPRAFSHGDRCVGRFRCKQPQSGNNSMLSSPSRVRGRGRKINQSLKIQDLASFLNAAHEASSSSAWCLSSIWMGADGSWVQGTAVPGGRETTTQNLQRATTSSTETERAE